MDIAKMTYLWNQYAMPNSDGKRIMDYTAFENAMEALAKTTDDEPDYETYENRIKQLEDELERSRKNDRIGMQWIYDFMAAAECDGSYADGVLKIKKMMKNEGSINEDETVSGLYNRFYLETAFMNCWNITDEVKFLYELILEGNDFSDMDPKHVDILANMLLGLNQLYNYKFEKADEIFNTLVKEGKIR